MKNKLIKKCQNPAGPIEEGRFLSKSLNTSNKLDKRMVLRHGLYLAATRESLNKEAIDFYNKNGYSLNTLLLKNSKDSLVEEPPLKEPEKIKPHPVYDIPVRPDIYLWTENGKPTSVFTSFEVRKSDFPEDIHVGNLNAGKRGLLSFSKLPRKTKEGYPIRYAVPEYRDEYILSGNFLGDKENAKLIWQNYNYKNKVLSEYKKIKGKTINPVSSDTLAFSKRYLGDESTYNTYLKNRKN